MRCSFTFSQIEDVLATIHNIADDRRGAFQGRLKHLQRSNFPTGTKPGKGKALSYTVEHLFMMVLALELIQAGVPPRLASESILRLWLPIINTIVTNSYPETNDLENLDEPEWYYWVVELEALSDLVKHEPNALLPIDRFRAVPFELFESYMAKSTGWRRLVVHGPTLTQEVFRIVSEERGWANIGDMRVDLLEIGHARAIAALSNAPALAQVMASVDLSHVPESVGREWVSLGWAKIDGGKLALTDFGAQTLRVIGGGSMNSR